jgi:hypothetical protein
MFRTRLYLFILCVVVLYSASNAQGYRAGDITYKWLYGYTYQIKYTTYTTNGPGTYQCSIDSACLGDGAHAIVLRSNGTSVLCSGGAHDGIPLPGGAIKLNEYATTHTFGGPGNYNICFEGANRNAGVINIPNSVNNTMSFESSLIISPIIAANSSPTFANLPIAYGCLSSSCFTYNPMASDIDGDSLAYEITNCTGYGPIVGYTFPSGGAGGSFSINPVTGTITWCNPQLTGEYNVKMKITEWRKDLGGVPILIGYVFRDNQFIISTCTGVNENKDDEQNGSVFPNPTNGILNIDLEILNEGKAMIQILNSLGEVLNTEHVSIQNPTLNIEQLPNGIYFLKITGNNNTNITKKIIKQ